MRIVRGIHLCGEGEGQIALIAVNAAAKVDLTFMMFILLHLQVDIAYRDLLITLVLEHQQAVSHLQATNIE